MDRDSENQRMRLFSRREFVKLTRGGGLLLVVPYALWGDFSLSDLESPTSSLKTLASRGRPLESLTERESVTVEAISARIIPTDETPGATEARVVDFIDHMLATKYAAQKPAYSNGLRRLDEIAQVHFGHPFAKLTKASQDSLLAQMDQGKIARWEEAAEFFSMVRIHTLEGMFSDPKYRGNAGGVGWKLVDQ